MAKIVKIQPTTLVDIAEAIREKTETTELIPTVEMAQRIRDIETLPTDATATEEDLLAGKVAYNNDGRFVGKLEEFDGGYEEDTTETDIDIYKQIIERTIRKFDMELELDHIGSYSFANCMYLTNVVLCKNIKTIDYGAFNDCINLKNIYLQNDQTLVTVNSSDFENCYGVIVHVPISLFNEYIENKEWDYLMDKKGFEIVGDL